MSLSLKTTLAIILSALCMLVAQASKADQGSDRNRNLESKVNRLETLVEQLSQRVSSLEYSAGSGVSGKKFACVLKDGYSSKEFLGTGKVRAQAEASAKQACGAVPKTYCYGTPTCSNPDDQVRGAFCELKDGYSSKTFSGEGNTLLEAQFNAKSACGSAPSTYCYGTPKCETY